MTSYDPRYPEGTRIEMVFMGNDPCPIEPGTQGTVTAAPIVELGDGPFTQLWVRWDDGRTLSPLLPPDTVRIIE